MNIYKMRKITLVSYIVKTFLSLAFLDVVIRGISGQFPSLHGMQSYYMTKKSSDSAIESGVLGVFIMLAIILFSGAKIVRGYKFHFNDGQFLLCTIVYGFFLGVLDKTNIRKSRFLEMNREYGIITGSIVSVCTYIVSALIVLSF